MVKKLLQPGRTGTRDWLIQRVSAVIMLAYFIYIAWFLYCHPGIDYITWRHLFNGLVFKIVTLLVVINMLVHAWVGLWTVLTDYVKLVKLRLLLQSLLILLLISCLLFTIKIIWG